MHRRTRELAILLHRWLSLILAPIFALILLSGAVLAMRPVVHDLGGPLPRIDAAALARTLERIDPGNEARRVEVKGGVTLVLRPAPGGAPEAAFDLATGAPAPMPGFEPFRFAQQLHEGLLLGAGAVVTAAAIAMALIVLAGLLLPRARSRRTLLGWHGTIGWWLLPLVAIAPITGALVGLGIAGPTRPPLPRPEAPVTIPQALATAPAAGIDLAPLENIRRMPDGTVMAVTRGGKARRYFLVATSTAAEMPGAPGVVRRIHEGTWGGAFSGTLNLLAALGLLGLLGTGLLSFVRRLRTSRRRGGDVEADLLVAFASQTGTAAHLADATAAALRAGGGRVATASLATLGPEELQRARRTLLIVSTTGDGEVPDQAERFLGRLAPGALTGASFALLALGDRRYGEANFAAGGRTVRAALLAAGATEVAPLAFADGDPAEAWRTWLDETSAVLHLRAAEVEAPAGDTPVELTLVKKRQLNDPSDPVTNEVWELTFESPAPLDFRPGDLLMVQPEPGEPERPYSIGSTAGRRIRLTVALTEKRAADGSVRLGKASGLLCRGLRQGDSLRAALRRHPAFHPPEDPARPMLLVAAGCGIAPFPGFLAEREEARAAGRRIGPAWLVFGNRRAASDFILRDELEGWLRSGVLTRLDTAFSRDEGGAYAQERLRERAAEVVDLLARQDGVLYVCGRASTLGKGVEAALLEILVEQELAADRAGAERLVARWEAEGRIRRDLFD